MNRRPVYVLNMTRLFSKEMFVYSFFDVKLKKPARMSTIGYFFGVGIPTWAIMFGLLHCGLTPVTLAIAGGIPFLSAITMSKPIWEGRKFLDWIKVQIIHVNEVKLFCDGWKAPKFQNYKIDFAIYVSRIKDFMKLKEMDDK